MPLLQRIYNDMEIIAIFLIAGVIVLLFWIYKKIQKRFTFSGYLDETFVKNGRKIHLKGFFDGQIFDVATGQEFTPKTRGNEQRN